MKIKIILIIYFVIGTIALYAQKGGSRKAILHEVSNKEVVQSIFPTATEVKKINEFWYGILDENGKTIGFAMNSTPYCEDVIGYNKQTPVMIITNKKGVIQKVALLSNWETFGYVKRLENAGFFGLWNGKSLKQADKVIIDGYTGATMTAKAVEKNVKFLIAQGIKVKPNSKL